MAVVDLPHPAGDLDELLQLVQTLHVRIARTHQVGQEHQGGAVPALRGLGREPGPHAVRALQHRLDGGRILHAVARMGMGEDLAGRGDVAAHEPDQRVRLEDEPAAPHVLVEDAGDGRGAEQLEHLHDVVRIVVERVEDVRHADVDAALALRLGGQHRTVVADVAVDVAQHLFTVAAAQLHRAGTDLHQQDDVRDPRLLGAHHRGTARDRVAPVAGLDRDGDQELIERNALLQQPVEELVGHRRKIVEVGEPEVGEPEVASQLPELDLVGQRVAVARGKGRLAERHVEDARLELAQAGHLRLDPFPDLRERTEIVAVEGDRGIE